MVQISDMIDMLHVYSSLDLTEEISIPIVSRADNPSYKVVICRECLVIFTGR